MSKPAQWFVVASAFFVASSAFMEAGMRDAALSSTLVQLIASGRLLALLVVDYFSDRSGGDAGV